MKLGLVELEDGEVKDGGEGGPEKVGNKQEAGGLGKGLEFENSEQN